MGSFPVKVPATWPNGSLIPGVDPASMLAPVGSADDRVMGYSYRLCITKNEANKFPFPVPEKYNPQDFELIRRYYKEVLSQTGREVTTKPYSALGYRGYPPRDKFDVCDDGTVTPITTDKANGARGYPNGTLESQKQDCRATQVLRRRTLPLPVDRSCSSEGNILRGETMGFVQG